METENKGLIDVRGCPCDGCQAKPCGHPARCVKFTLWLNKTVDAVEVVRCKDCKNNGQCSIQDAMNWTPKTEIVDYFCSYGEKRDDGNG